MGQDKPLVSWQLPMKRVLWALLPSAFAGIYFFGWRVLLLYVVVHIAGFLSEYAFARHYKQQVSSSVFVTNMLFAMIAPPSLPLWMAVVGIVFGVVFGKMVFGGFGKNIFNPALVGRAFIYVTFAVYMTGMWYEPFGGLAGGLLSYAPDSITSATVLSEGQGTMSSVWLNAFLGNISGSAGETSALAIILGGLYLVIKKVASKEIIITTVIGLLIPQTLFWYFGVNNAIDPLTAMLTGGFMLGLFFMTTDPVSAPKTNIGKILYGLFIGSITSVIRTFSVWPEGMMFAILLGNMLGPITDYAINEQKKKKKEAISSQTVKGGN
jgi:Na+-transporting NADH:ubiquinone oxidoreductase subunit B